MHIIEELELEAQSYPSETPEYRLALRKAFNRHRFAFYKEKSLVLSIAICFEPGIRGKRDLDALAHPIMNALTKSKVIKDDGLITMLVVRKHYDQPKHLIRVTLTTL